MAREPDQPGHHLAAASNAYGINVSLPATGHAGGRRWETSLRAMLDTVPQRTNGKPDYFRLSGSRYSNHLSENRITRYSAGTGRIRRFGSPSMRHAADLRGWFPITRLPHLSDQGGAFSTNNQQQGLDGFQPGQRVRRHRRNHRRHPENILSALVSGGNSLTGGGVLTPGKIIPISTAQFQASQALLTGGMAMFAARRFTQLDVVIDPNPTPRARRRETPSSSQITHPFDPARDAVQRAGTSGAQLDRRADRRQPAAGSRRRSAAGHQQLFPGGAVERR